VGEDRKRGVASLLRQAQESFPDLACCVEL
jgi:hypothetical protein